MNLPERLRLCMVRRRGCFGCGSGGVVLAVRDIDGLKGSCLPCLLGRNGPYRALLRSSWHWSSEPLLRGPVNPENLDGAGFAKAMRAALRAREGLGSC